MNKNAIIEFITQQQTIQQAFLDAITTENMSLMKDLLQKGANPNISLKQYPDNCLDAIFRDWHLPTILQAVELLFAYQANPNYGILEAEEYEYFRFEVIKSQMERLQSDEPFFAYSATIPEGWEVSVTEKQHWIVRLESIYQLLLSKCVPCIPLLPEDKLPLFRYGIRNPEPIQDNIYFHIITNNISPYQLPKIFKTEDGANKDVPRHEIPDHRVWHYRRSGTSRTILPDGSILFIGGSHEVFYDTDFCVFNDVLKVDPTGKMELFFYPTADFPATHFHTATFWKDKVIIIGDLDFISDKEAYKTLVCCLNLSDFSIQKMKNTDNPGWILEHEAFEYEEQIMIHGGQIYKNDKFIENKDIYSFNPKTGVWTLL
jgi:hypothetical protein